MSVDCLLQLMCEQCLYVWMWVGGWMDVWMYEWKYEYACLYERMD